MANTVNTEKFIKNVEERGNAPDIVILGEYINVSTKILVHCNRCGTDFYTNPSSLYSHRCCKVCAKEKLRFKKTSKSITDNNPVLASFLKNKEDGYRYTESSAEKLEWKCPECGDEVIRTPHSMMGVFRCRKCGESYSLPNKICYNMLDELNVQFFPEKRFDWAKYENGNPIVYDFYVPSKNIIIEMQGIQHYKQRNYFFNSDLKTNKKNDEYKKKLAISNGISFYYQVDASKSDFYFIKDSLTRQLFTQFDFTRLNWNNILQNVSNGRIKEICVYYEKNKDSIMNDLKHHFHISNETLRKYLTIGNDLGFCDYNQEESNKRIYDKRRRDAEKEFKKTKNKVCKYFNEHPHETQKSISNALNISQRKVGNSLKIGTLEGICNYIPMESIIRGTKKNKKWDFKICQCGLDGSLIKVFESLDDASLNTGFNKAGIRNALKGVQETSYGFIWKKFSNENFCSKEGE